VVNPGWGDNVQANKAGLLEIADLFVINKADRKGVEDTRRDLEDMLTLSELGEWRPPIVPTVASKGEGVEELWTQIQAHRAFAESSGLLDQRRAQRMRHEMRSILVHRLERRARSSLVDTTYEQLEADVLSRRLDPWAAVDRLIEALD
jgi:LAO/AO transport system kinase